MVWPGRGIEGASGQVGVVKQRRGQPFAPGDASTETRFPMIALTTLGIALLWIALSMLVALILGQILGQREAQLATDSAAWRQPARWLG